MSEGAWGRWLGLLVKGRAWVRGVGVGIAVGTSNCTGADVDTSDIGQSWGRGREGYRLG